MLIRKDKKEYEIFEYGDYIIEVEHTLKDNIKFYGCWLHKRGYGIKMYMFGTFWSEDYIKIILNNIETNISIYKEEYEDYE